MKKTFCAGFVFFAAAFVPAAVLAGNNAQFISQTVPQTMTVGQTYSVSVTMKNTGTAAWTETDKYRLGSQNPQDNWVWREGRVYLAAGESIAPGQTKTFTFDVKAPATPGAYNFQWQMVQDGVEWFGGVSANIVINVIVGQAEIPLGSDLFGYAAFAGANVLERSTCWIPDENEANIIIKSAKKMHLRMLRLPVLSHLADNTDCWGLNNIKNFMDKADKNGLKVIVVLNGYTKYEGYCSWQAGFVDVKDGAAKIVAALKNHPALFAWDLLNEPLWGADNSGCGSAADHQSTIKAVNAMHDLVRSIDSKTPLTVGEGKDEYLSQWNGITNFASPHIYCGGSGGACTADEFRNRIRYFKSQVGSLPVVIGEFGIVVPPATESDRAGTFATMYQIMEQEDVGSMFWLLSTDESNQGTMSPINADGSFKPTAEAIMRALPDYNNNAQFISQAVPQTMTAGQTYSVSVVMKNTGTAAWLETDKYRLGSQNPQDNWIWREGRVYLAAGESIAPGQTKTFTFDVKAPATPGAYNFQWQMVQEGVEWFDEKTSNVTVSVVRAVCVADQVSGCKVCKADGSGWADNNSKCAAGQVCSSGSCVPKDSCVAKTCATLGNYQCGSWSDGCGAMISCGACTGGKTCNASGQCVLQTTGGPVVESEQRQQIQQEKLTRTEIIAKIAEIKQLLIQLIIQLIAELQKQLAALK